MEDATNEEDLDEEQLEAREEAKLVEMNQALQNLPNVCTAKAAFAGKKKVIYVEDVSVSVLGFYMT